VFGNVKFVEEKNITGIEVWI